MKHQPRNADLADQPVILATNIHRKVYKLHIITIDVRMHFERNYVIRLDGELESPGGLTTSTYKTLPRAKEGARGIVERGIKELNDFARAHPLAQH